MRAYTEGDILSNFCCVFISSSSSLKGRLENEVVTGEK